MTNTKQLKTARAPSRRDQDIFRRITVHGEKQTDIATELHLSPGRISQIVARVRRWVATGVQGLRSKVQGQFEPTLDMGLGALDWLERQRLERTLARERHQAIYSLAMREAARQTQNPKHTTVRTEQKESHDEPTKIVKTVRDSAVNVQLYKLAQRSATELQKLAELDPLPSPEVQHEGDRRELLDRLLTELLGDAVAANKIRSTGWSDEREFVEDLTKFLLGEPHRGLATNIIAADAQHGRRRDGDKSYPGRDPLRMDGVGRAVPAAAREGEAPAEPNPLPVREGASPPGEAGEGLSALMKAKPTTAGANESTKLEPTSDRPSTADGATTCDHSSLNPEPRTLNPVPHKKPTTFSAPGGTVIYLGPASPAEFDRMFHPWSREF
jgi:BMFP domain-containing protein YqiC